MVSSHKNEYCAGVRIGNWVEELFGKEAPDAPPLQISSIPQAPTTACQALVADPKGGEPADLLFSHGSTFGQSFNATMNGLHYSSPAQREYGARSSDRVHNTFYWGSKHMDSTVPATDPNARTALLEAKRQRWADEQKSAGPVTHDAFLTSNAVAGL